MMTSHRPSILELRIGQRVLDVADLVVRHLASIADAPAAALSCNAPA